MAQRQDRLLEDNLTSWGQILERLQNTPAFLAALSTRSYTAQRLTQLQTQHQAATAAYEQRNAAMGEERNATDQFKAALAANKKEHQTYRKLLRRLPINDNDLQTIQVSPPIPRDFQLYVIQTRTGYTALASNPTLLSQTTPLGYGLPQLTAMSTALNTLLTLDNLQETAKGKAKAATQTRNTLYNAFKTEMELLLTVATILAQDHPDWLALLQSPSSP